jgi:CheY-like chemotaxis protein
MALRQAQAEADAANRAKSEFLSRMSHDLRTPLNAVLGFAQVLELDELSTDQRDSVNQILKGGRHLLELINEVLDIARIDAGRLPISLEPVAMAEVGQEVLALIAPQATARNIELDNRLDAADERHVLADRQRRKQVLLNLLSNAVKYNRAGGRVTLTCDAPAAGHLRLIVRDTGYGITPADLARLFIAFERLHADQQGVEGTGLGLALSKRLVEAMGGSVGVESTAGVGSTFWIKLPIAEDRPVEPSEPDALPSAAASAAAAPVRTVLYIEDNLSNTKLMERILAPQPHIRLLTAIQGRLGLELAREHQPDLILLDLHLPDVPGLEVLRHLKGDPHTQAIAVVMRSADAMGRQVERLQEAGAHTYLTKPLDVRHFLHVVNERLSQSQ